MALTSTKLNSLPKIAEGKVRDLYEIDKSTLLFVATDRISAYDVIMDNVSLRLPGYTELLRKTHMKVTILCGIMHTDSE